VLLQSVASAQPYGADFSVNATVGCAPFTVVVTDNSGAPDTIAVNYDWGDGSALDSGSVHTYTAAGTYDIIQTVANGNPRQDTVTITVVDIPPPTFLVFKCSGTRGAVVLTDSAYTEYYIDWDDGTADVVAPGATAIHDFGALGTYMVTVKGLVFGSGNPLDSANIRCAESQSELVIDDIFVPAVIDTITVVHHDNDSGAIEISHTLERNTLYRLEYQVNGSGPFILADTLGADDAQASTTIGGLNTDDNYYCFRITAIDPCGTVHGQSNTLCSVRLELIAENNRIRLNWQTGSGDFRRYRIYKDGSLLVFVNSIGSNEYIDENLVCNNEYCYTVYLEENSGYLSRAFTLCQTATSDTPPDPIENIDASVVDGVIILNWYIPEGQNPVRYTLDRSTDGTTTIALDTSALTQYIDSTARASTNRYFYTVYYTDPCGNLSRPSIAASPVLLRIDEAGNLSWSAYEGWTGGIAGYWLEKYDMDGNLLESLPMGLATQYVPPPDQTAIQQLSYRIRVEPADGTLGTVFSNIVDVIFRSVVYFPTAFTPDGDGLNDSFTFVGRFIARGQLMIFNRWGELIFTTEDMHAGWDGRAFGKPAPPGTYLYRAELTDEMGVQFIKQGQIVLLK
jgi:gliding motility-associated-like protein